MPLIQSTLAGSRSLAFGRIVFALYAAFVAFVSLRPLGTAVYEPWDKLVHLLVYAAFACLGHRTVRSGKAFGGVCAGIVAYGGLMEILQALVPGRMSDPVDFASNAAGVLTGALLASRWPGPPAQRTAATDR